MPFTACQTQTLNKNNKDTHYKNKHPHKHFCAGDARVHYSQTKQQEATKTKQAPTKGARVLMSQNPNSVLDNPTHQRHHPRSTQPTTPEENRQLQY